MTDHTSPAQDREPAPGRGTAPDSDPAVGSPPGSDAAVAAPEQRPEPAPGAATAHRTGHRLVDEVLASLADLDTRSVAEQVGVFEAADRRLREALADAARADLAGGGTAQA